MIAVGNFDTMTDSFNATVCTKMFHLFQKLVFDSLYVISFSHTVNNEGSFHMAEKAPVLKSFLSINGNGSSDKIKILFLDCFYSFLDGLEYIASNSDPKDSSLMEDIDGSEENGLPFKLSCSKMGSIILEDASSGIKLKSKAELNRDPVIFLFLIIRISELSLS